MKHILIALCLSVASLYGQQEPKISLRAPYQQQLKKIAVPIADTSLLYVNDGESTNLFYVALVPKHRIKGALVLFPPTGETVEEVFNNNARLVTLACDSGVITIVPSLNYNLCLDTVALGFLNHAFGDMLNRYSVPANKIILGGFSLGGMNAIRYTEMAFENSNATAIKPVAVYGVDPPLDWARMYYTFSRTIQKNFSEPAVLEARLYIDKLNAQFGGSPSQFPKAYSKYSMYLRSDSAGGNAKYLKNIPIRIYTDPDIQWQLNNRRVDYYDMNVLDQAAMINQLNQAGNSRAELVVALGKGYRPDGRRHPHSWSIVDAVDFNKWMMACLR